MTALLQSHRLMTLQTILGGDILVLERIKGREALCEGFRFELLLLTRKHELDLKDLIASPMAVILNSGLDTPRYFHGYVSEAERLDVNDGYTSYHVILSPFSIFLQHRFNCRAVSSFKFQVQQG